jgi:hypothetical protein
VSGITFDAGVLIGIDRNERRMLAFVTRALAASIPLTIPAGVVAQVWRNGRQQARLARFLRERGVTIEPLDGQRARQAGQLCGMTGTADVIDASVVLCAKRRGDGLATCDVEDMRRLDPTVSIIDL